MRKKASMRKAALKAWLFGVVAPTLVGIVLYTSAYLLLPPTADGVSVTVHQCVTVQDAQHAGALLDCQGTTLFRRTFTDEATVSAVRAALDGIHPLGLFTTLNCNGGSLCEPTQVYSFDLLWHGSAVKSYMASV